MFICFLIRNLFKWWYANNSISLRSYMVLPYCHFVGRGYQPRRLFFIICQLFNNLIIWNDWYITKYGGADCPIMQLYFIQNIIYTNWLFGNWGLMFNYYIPYSAPNMVHWYTILTIKRRGRLPRPTICLYLNRYRA